MRQFIKRLLCRHEWKMISKPYLWNTGMTKRADFRCVKCNKVVNKDLWHVNRWAD